MPKLKQIREQKNLTQEELSKISGLSVRTIQRVESGVEPKGHTLKSLIKALGVTEQDLKITNNVNTEEASHLVAVETKADDINYQKIKLINLSSILFVVLPPFNIIIPLLLSRIFKQKNELTNQIISIQLIWTILAPLFFMIGIFLKWGNAFTIFSLVAIVLSNVYIILRNLAEIDRKQQLYYKLNFSVL